jgi:hypothetical protein
MMDLVHALSYVAGDENADDVLHLSQSLLEKHPNEVARVAKALMDARAAVARHPEAQIPDDSLFWDELLDVVANVVDPVDLRTDQLPEKLIDALTDDESAKLGGIYANYLRYRDELTYDRANLNGQAFNVTENRVIEMRTDVDRTKGDTGTNRSSFQRFLQMVHDTHGVAACNKAGATLFVPANTLTGVIFNVTLPATGCATLTAVLIGGAGAGQKGAGGSGANVTLALAALPRENVTLWAGGGGRIYGVVGDARNWGGGGGGASALLLGSLIVGAAAGGRRLGGAVEPTVEANAGM